MWNFNMDEIRAEAAAMSDDFGGKPPLPAVAEGQPAAPAAGTGSRPGSRPLSPTPGSPRGDGEGLKKQTSVQKGRFTVMDDDAAPMESGGGGGGGGGGDAAEPSIKKSTSVQKGRFTVVDEGEDARGGSSHGGRRRQQHDRGRERAGSGVDRGRGEGCRGCGEGSGPAEVESPRAVRSLGGGARARGKLASLHEHFESSKRRSRRWWTITGGCAGGSPELEARLAQ